MTNGSDNSGPDNSGPGKSDRDEFDRYLSGRSSVSRSYAELGAEGPPPDLDARVLALAARAAKVRVFPVAGKARKWMAPVALAATVLLSFSLVMSIVMETPTSIDDGFGFRELRRNLPAAPGKGPALDERDQPAMSAETFGEIAEELKASRTLGMVGDAMSGREMEQGALPRLRERQAAPVAAYGKVSPESADDLGPIIDVIREQIILERRPALAKAAKAAADVVAFAPETAGPELSDAEMSDAGMSASGRLATTRKLDATITPAARLEEILRLYDGNEAQAAAEAIEEFRRTYPDHPVSVLLLERGY